MPSSANSNNSLDKYFKEHFEKSAKSAESAESVSKERRAASKVNTNLAAISPNIEGSLPLAERKFICDIALTKKIISEDAALVEIYPSSKRLGEGSFGYTTSAEIHLQGRSKFSCIAALKITKGHGIEELQSDTLIEMGAYARLKGKPCLSTALFMKLTPTQRKSVMEHYILDLEKLFKNHIHQRLSGTDTNWLEEFVKSVMFQVLTGLNEMHKEYFIHKDLKPENILMGHNGLVFVADYGLSIYNPVGFNLGQEYYGATTPTIYPPEAVEKYPLNDTFDSWSAGCTLGYFLTGEYHFDFYREGPDWEDTLISTNTLSASYTAKRRELLASVVDLNSQITTNSDCLNLLKALLTLDPNTRLRVKDALEHPWFKGMTIARARSNIQTVLGNTLLAGAKPARGSIRNLTAKVKRQAVSKATHPSAANSDVDAYFPIESANTSSAGWKPFVSGATKLSNRSKLVTFLFRFHFRWRYTSPIAILHTIELFDRYIAIHRERIYTEDEFNVLMLLLYSIAVKVSPVNHIIRPQIDFDSIMKKVNISKTALSKMEIEIVKDLCGDVLPQKDGLVSKYVGYLGTSETSILVMMTRYSIALFIEGLINLGPVDHRRGLAAISTAVDCILEGTELPTTGTLPKIQRTLAAATSNRNLMKKKYKEFIVVFSILNKQLNEASQKILNDFLNLSELFEGGVPDTPLTNLEYTFNHLYPASID